MSYIQDDSVETISRYNENPQSLVRRRWVMIKYQVIDLSGALIAPNTTTVEASSPEKAAEAVLGIHLVRSGARKDRKARVYWRTPGQPENMVRLYSQVAEQSLR